MSKRVSTDDYIAISDHMGRYCHYIDGGQPEKWAACFTEDGVFAGPVTPEPVVGRAALKGFAEATYANSNGGTMRHLVGNMNADYGDSPDVIVAHLYNYVTVWGGGAGQHAVMALCETTFVRDGDGWLIKRNAFSLCGH
jgi:hypothetical protein